MLPSNSTAKLLDMEHMEIKQADILKEVYQYEKSSAHRHITYFHASHMRCLLDAAGAGY